jgi:hypothetical protein
MSKFNGFFDNFSKALGNPKGNLGDFAHASALYVRNNLRLAPKFRFLYHVVIDVNQLALLSLGNVSSILNKREFNLLVESVSLPSYNITTDTKNQYNRKKVIQTGINYDPLTFVFHDDNAGLTTLLWESYFRYYYQDPNYASVDAQGQPSSTVPISYSNNLYQGENLNNFRYGLDKDRRVKEPFFNSITVNQLHPQEAQSKFTSFTIINPLIATMQHDTMEQTSGTTTKNTMRFEYEAMFYGRGITQTDNPAGFADPAHYDVTPSPLSIEGGGTTALFGRGGLTDGFTKVFRDIETNSVDLGTFITGLNTFRNAQELSTQGLRNEGFQILEGGLNVVSNSVVNGLNNILIPNKNNSNSNITNTNASRSGFANNSIFALNTSDARSLLANNQSLRDDFAFSQVYAPSINTGNINDKKAQWNALSRTAKNEIGQIAIDNFNTLKTRARNE